MRQNLRAYQNIGTQSALVDADPHKVIEMLMQGALDRMAEAKGAIERNDIQAKHTAVTRAIGIIQGLQDALDFKANEEISNNLYALYDYMMRRLVEANANRDASIVEECMRLLSPLADAWKAIPAEAKAEYQRLKTQP